MKLLKTISALSLLMGAFAMSFTSCSSDDELGGDPGKNDPVAELQAAKQQIKSKLFGATVLDETPIANVARTDFHWDKPVDIVNILPEGKTPQAAYSNYYYYATGEPFTVVMLYTHGLYTHEAGIYWYDDAGNCYEQSLWKETEETNKVTWNNHYRNGDTQNKAKEISRISDKAGAYTINLPKNTRFGFYQVSYNDGKVVQGGIETTCTTCNGTGKTGTYIKKTCTACNGKGKVIKEKKDYKFYSEVSKNWNNKCQTVTFNYGDWTIVGFEDIDRASGSDNDFNDCVFAVNPKLNIVPLPIEEDTIIPQPTPDPEPIPTPDPEPIVYKNQGSVETNLSFTEKHDGENLLRLSIHVRDTTDVTVVLPFVDQALADDFAIVAKHDVEFTYSEPITINGQTVELIYGVTEEGYLTVTTKGITAEILDYCRNTYADGLTFECNLSLPNTCKFLDTPSISFTKEPLVYITSCVNNSSEAIDYEVVWTDGGNKVYETPNFGDPEGLTYDHKFYSRSSLETLKSYGWFSIE